MPPDRLTIAIPMAGEGRRFVEAGFALPKPLIDIEGKPMITRVLENLHVPQARYVLIAQRSAYQAHRATFDQATSGRDVRVVLIDETTEGAACTLLHAVREINQDSPLLLANSDQLVDLDVSLFLDDAKARNLDGSILTFSEPTRDPKWSYAELDSTGRVTQTREKVAISTHATVGLYWFRRGRDFVESACEMIAHNDRFKNEFYTCPTYNYAIRAGRNIGTYEIPRTKMHGLGTPADLRSYLERGRA